MNSHCFICYKVTKNCLNVKDAKGHFVTNRPNMLTNGKIIKTKTNLQPTSHITKPSKKL